MRRLWAASAVILVCLALGGMPALAQDASEVQPGAVWVTGVATCRTVEEGTTTTVGGVEQHRGMVDWCSYTASDPRVAEPTSTTSSWDCYTLAPDGASHGCWGWGTLESPNWTGYATIVIDGSGGFVTHVTMIGRGTNAGWTYVVTDTPQGFSGLLYDGEPPPFELSPSAKRE